MLTRLGRWAWKRSDADPWTNVYGVARSLLAVGTLLTLAFNAPAWIFHPVAGLARVPVCYGVARAGLFCQLPFAHLQPARWLAVAILAVVASGWRPRWTGIAHWWVAFSLFTSGTLVDGGDQVTGVLTLLLIPVTLGDARAWHWDPPAAGAPSATGRAMRLVAWSCLLVARIQVAAIYFHAAIGKFRVEEWTDGTVLYYWLTDPVHGMPPWFRWALLPVLTSGIGVALLTWSVLVLETVLFMALVMERRWWRLLLPVGLAFHLGIALLHGLVSFAFAMWAALVLYLRPHDQPFSLPRLRIPEPGPEADGRRVHVLSTQE
ncbi:MAG: hypothetical protein JWM27_4111 [Gemmatimonadetes bacterium]|nr:hypothetical protein [Gemmatimonadota bacterium]